MVLSRRARTPQSDSTCRPHTSPLSRPASGPSWHTPPPSSGFQHEVDGVLTSRELGRLQFVAIPVLRETEGGGQTVGSRRLLTELVVQSRNSLKEAEV